MNATIRLVISASSLPPTSGRAARSSDPGSLIADLVVLCLSVVLTGASSPPLELMRLKRTHGSRQHTLSVPERGLLNRLYSVGIGVVSDQLRSGCAARGWGSQASAQSTRARSRRPTVASGGGCGNVRPTTGVSCRAQTRTVSPPTCGFGGD